MDANKKLYHTTEYIQACSKGQTSGGGGHIVLGGDNVPPLVEIGLTDLPKSGWGHMMLKFS